LATNESLGARLYVSGRFVKLIEHSGEAVIIPTGIQQLLFEKEGYKPYSENVDISTTVNVDLKKTGESTAISSPATDNHKSISVYPNPTKGIIKIESEEIIQTVELFDLTGKLLLNTQFNQSNPEFSIENYREGNYLLRIITSEGVAIRKILKW